MNVFFELLLKLLPLYGLIILGFIAGQRLHVDKKSIAPLLIYMVTPFIVFDGVLRAPLTLGQFSLPAIMYGLCCVISFTAYRFAGKIWPDSHKNILAYSAAAANTGYFGLPVAIAFWGESVIGTAVLILFGFTLFENTVGYFIVARGQHTVKESLIKVLKLPSVYTFMLGIVLSGTLLAQHEIYNATAGHFRGAYTMLGMMMIGLGLSKMEDFRLDFKFIGFAFVYKFLVWPLVIAAFIYIDIHWLQWMTTRTYQVLMLMAIVPLAANIIAFATLLNAHPEKASITVLLSTLFAIVYIPIMMFFFIL